MIKIAHVMRIYLEQPETFIWQYIHNFTRVTPIVIARKTMNLDQFPVTNGVISPTYGPKLSFPWIMDNLNRRIFHDSFGYAASIIKRKNVKAIHAHFGPLGFSYLPLSLSLKIPLIVNFYGYDLSREDVISENREAYAELFEHAAKFLVEGPSMQKKLTSIGCPDKKISIQRIAINLENYKFKVRSWDSKKPVRLLFVGRFVEKKGLEFALRALARIKKDFVFRFRIIGGGELEEELHSLASTLGFDKEIEWIGMRTHRNVIEEINNCDILVQPSVTARNGDSEGGAPTIIIEAQACGVPVISTTHADIPYVTVNTKSALLSPERDVEHLERNIRCLLDASSVWAEMGTLGRKHVECHHDVKKEVISLEDLYMEVINENS